MCMEDMNIARALKSNAYVCPADNETVIPGNPDRIAIRLCYQGTATVIVYINAPNRALSGQSQAFNLTTSYADQDAVGEQILRQEPQTLTLWDVGEFLKQELRVLTVGGSAFLTDVYLPVNAGASPDIAKLPK